MQNIESVYQTFSWTTATDTIILFSFNLNITKTVVGYVFFWFLV